MSDVGEIAARGIVMGIVGAALMDLWSLALRRGFAIPTLDYAMLGRWIGHVPRGHLFHDRIATAAQIRGERVLGWLAHYGIGIAFAFVPLAIWGVDWVRSPSIGPALLVGLGTIVAPWFLMQPGMGAGIAASRTPNPAATRARNLGTHAVYGLGLYLAAVVLALV